MKTPEEIIEEICCWDDAPVGEMVREALDAAGYVIVPKEPPPGWSDLAWSDLLIQITCFPRTKESAKP